MQHADVRHLGVPRPRRCGETDSALEQRRVERLAVEADEARRRAPALRGDRFEQRPLVRVAASRNWRVTNAPVALEPARSRRGTPACRRRRSDPVVRDRRTRTAAARAPPVKSGACPRPIAQPARPARRSARVRGSRRLPRGDRRRTCPPPASAPRERAVDVAARPVRADAGRVGPQLRSRRRHDPADAIGAASSKRHDLLVPAWRVRKDPHCRICDPPSDQIEHAALRLWRADRCGRSDRRSRGSRSRTGIRRSAAASRRAARACMLVERRAEADAARIVVVDEDRRELAASAVALVRC